MAESPLFAPELRTKNATYEAQPCLAAPRRDRPHQAQRRRHPASARRAELEIIVETDGESTLVVDGLTLITEFWREIGVSSS
jgi:peptide/nickel transport system substrate-binding protein